MIGNRYSYLIIKMFWYDISYQYYWSLSYMYRASMTNITFQVAWIINRNRKFLSYVSEKNTFVAEHLMNINLVDRLIDNQIYNIVHASTFFTLFCHSRKNRYFIICCLSHPRTQGSIGPFPTFEAQQFCLFFTFMNGNTFRSSCVRTWFYLRLFNT